jgi:uncharacterized protein YegP (UPF0339 family)
MCCAVRSVPYGGAWLEREVRADETKGTIMYFAIVSASGGYRAHAYGANNELVWWTEVYTYKSGAQNAIAMLKAGAATAPVYDRT